MDTVYIIKASLATTYSASVRERIYTVRHNYRRVRPPSFRWHNSVNIRFIYLKISGNIAEGILNLQI